MYFLVALIVAIVSILVPCLLSLFFYRDNAASKMIISGIFSAIYTLILWFVFWKLSVGVYGPIPLAFSMLIGLVLACFACYDFEEGEFASLLTPVTILVVYLVVIGIISFSNSSVFQSRAQVSLIGQVKSVTNLAEVIKPADNKHICLVSKEIAKTNAQNALSKVTLKDGAIAGSRYEIGEPTKQFVDGTYWWIFPLEFQGYFKWNQDPQVPGYLRVSAENPSEQPQAVQLDKNNQEIHVKYLNSAAFDFRADRYLRTHGFINAILDDWTYEVDDNWRPYYTVSVLERTLGFAGYITKGIVLLDLQTGDIKYFGLDQIPSWIDRVIPLDVIDTNAKRWGEYSLAAWWYNVWHDDKAQQPTPGWFLTYNGQDCQWFTGFTSTNSSDKALTGFMTVDAKNGQASFFKVSGVTEDLAYDASKTLWNNYAGYTPTELVPYNIYGVLTYVIPMQCNNQFSGVSLVALNNINIKAKGTTLEEALQGYRTAINDANSTGLVPNAEKPNELKLTGVVQRIGLSISSTNNKNISFKLVGVGKIFNVAYSDTNPKPLLLKEGDTVVITYLETTEIVVPVSSFDIPIITLEQGSVIQSQKVQQENNTNQEVDRIDDQQTVDNLINSDAMKNVDPEELKKFLEEQQKNQ